MTFVEVDPVRAKAALDQFGSLAARAGVAVPPGDFRFTRHRICYAPNKGVAELRDAIVLSGEWFVIFGQQAFLDAFHQTPYPPLSAYHMGLVPPNHIDLMYPPPTPLPVAEAFLLGGCPNYCHWIMDYLPRIDLLRGALPVLVNRPLAPFQTESLQALGLKLDLLSLDYPQAYVAPVLRFPSLTSSWCLLPVPFRMEVLEWIRTRFAALEAPGPRKRRIFVTRAAAQTAAGRRLANSDEIVRVAERHGFEIVACEVLPFAEQVRLFSQADAVAGPHGAGFTNLAFAPRGCRVIELAGPRLAADQGRCTTAFRLLAQMLQMEFTRVIGRSDAPVESGHLPNETFTIDPAEFDGALERLNR